jgi:hypothetical protein
MSAMDEDTKDEGAMLEQLSSVLTALHENPYDLAKHHEHIQLASSLPGMEGQAIIAREMMVETWAAPEGKGNLAPLNLKLILCRRMAALNRPQDCCSWGSHNGKFQRVNKPV